MTAADGFADVARLASLLEETEQHHGAYEASAPAHHWWDFYAAYIVARIRGQMPAEASEAAARYVTTIGAGGSGR